MRVRWGACVRALPARSRAPLTIPLLDLGAWHFSKLRTSSLATFCVELMDEALEVVVPLLEGYCHYTLVSPSPPYPPLFPLSPLSPSHQVTVTD
jgi:hypothetical protein